MIRFNLGAKSMPVSPIRRMFHCLRLAPLFCLTGCYSASKESLPGRYTVKFDWGESTLELRKDGTFTEEATVKGGTKKRIEGKWSFNDGINVSRAPCLNLDHADVDDKPVDSCSDSAHRWGAGFVEIAIDPDHGYSYQK
jgi:hypothetical protein